MSEIKKNHYLTIYDGKNTDHEIPENEVAYFFPFPLDLFQKEGIYRIYKNENILITAHTGSGKTILAEYAIFDALKKNKKIIYTSPIKSLSNQKYAEFSKKFGKDSLGILTGDIKMNPEAPCLIMTTEILRNLLYKPDLRNQYINMNDVQSVIFDEVHYINDPDRGKVWEECIVMLPPRINLVMLSATIDKADQFAGWIGNSKQKPIHLISTTHRVVPLRHYFWKPTMVEINGKEELQYKMIELCDHQKNFKNYGLVKTKYQYRDINKIMDKLLDFLVEDNHIPSLFFKLSRKKCETICRFVRKTLVTFEEESEIHTIFESYMKDYKHIYEPLPQYQDLYKQLKKGVAYHHSGLIPILKEIVEILYAKGLIKILFATETFSIGVNMPTKTVLFSELEKFDNNGQRLLRNDEYLQMSGRAGRRGLDLYGTVIILPTMDLITENEMKSMMTGSSPCLQSKFNLSYQFVLKTAFQEDFNMDLFLENTLIVNENNKKIEGLQRQKEEYKTKLINITISEEYNIILKRYAEIDAKLKDTFFSLKKKDQEKLQKEKTELENRGSLSKLPFYSLFETYKKQQEYKKEIDTIHKNIDWFTYFLKDSIENMIELLHAEQYVDSNKKLTKKGIIASSINECQELVFTEIIVRGLFDNLEFPEIVSIIASFINEKDGGNEQLYVNDLHIPTSVKKVLKEANQIAEYYEDLQNERKLYVNSDYTIYLDFVVPAYIWASGGSIQDVYKETTIYDGNFVKAIMRINSICENLMEIFQAIERYDLCKKMENYNQILIRDVANNISLYVR